jgi:hypothetical protein
VKERVLARLAAFRTAGVQVKAQVSRRSWTGKPVNILLCGPLIRLPSFNLKDGVNCDRRSYQSANRG